jgi:hypothetical protein
MDSPRLGCLGFLAAAAAPAIAATVLSGTTDAFIPVFVAAAAHVALIALPLYLMLDLRYRATLPRVIGAAIMVGALPIPLAVFPPFLLGGFGGVDVVRSAATAALVLGGFGAVGGLAFWLVIGAPWRRGAA